ncbi:MAG: (Fe-S)-binding protein [Gammaproteobacteria bacterium]|nr:(Fe-S)-binding protein [Gammaproteobacteria bacterium]
MTIHQQLDNTDLCVMCGMCLPGCPTYQIYKVEAESPRGRIALIQALKNGQLSPDENTLKHLNHCLGCLSCEAMCPSQVPFGQLIDTIKQVTNNDYHKPYLLRKLLRLNEQPGGLGRFQSIYRILNKPVINQLANLGLQLARQPNSAINALMAQSQQASPLAIYYPASGKIHGSVALFTGCMTSSFDIETLQSSVRLLTSLGFDVHIPQNQFCCGAMHQHNGEPETAAILAGKNKQLFQNLNVDVLLWSASGCGSQLAISDLAVPAQDIRTFLLEQIQNKQLRFSSLNQKVLVHESCSSRNALGLSGLTKRLLQHIPDISLLEPAQADLCCGAGGSQQIVFAEQAKALLDIKINNLEELNSNCLVSDNLSCSLHYKAGLKRRNIQLEVIHPITLLARQLK